MANVTKRITETATLLAVLYGARRYYRNWGATKAECQMLLPGDTLVADPAIQTTEAVYIDAPVSAVWPWLLQMGQDRGGFYGCEGLKNLAGLRASRRRSSPPGMATTCGGRRGAPGARRLDGAARRGDVEGRRRSSPEKYLVLKATRPDRRWNAVWSFHVQPHWEDRVRLLTRARIALRHPGEVFAMELVRPVLALGTRGLLLGIKHRVERLPATEPARPAVEIP